jgi:glucosamine kinase
MTRSEPRAGDHPTGAAHVIGIDGGGTRTRVAIAGPDGTELLRRVGPPGLIDPQGPDATAETLVELVRDTAAEAGVSLPVHALCAGLAGAGLASAREPVRAALATSGLAHRVDVVSDGQIALEGALEGDAGILLVAGTGSIAFGRAEDGRIDRCGGWGHLVGDEGSGYTIARAGLMAALQAADGRAEPTRLLPDLLEHLELESPRDIPAWVARTAKGEVAALAPRVARLAAAGDPAAVRIIDAAADHLADHVKALLDRLGPWAEPVPVVFLGGALADASYRDRVRARLRDLEADLALREAAADAVAGAIRHARSL